MQYTFEKRYFVVPRAEIAYLRFILEGYDGLAFLRTLEARTALVEIAFAASRRADAEALLAALAAEVPLAAVPPPAAIPPL